MTTEKLAIQSIIWETLRNGTRDNINSHEDILGFILGALDCGFTVKLSGYMPYAKYGKIEVRMIRNRDTDNLKLIIFKGQEKQVEFDYSNSGFRWMNAEVNRGRFNVEIKDRLQFICSTT